jgi:hypothetical protein
MWAKHIIDNFDGFFEGAEIFLTPKLPERSEGQFWVQKCQGPSKNLDESPIMCFASIQKIKPQTIRISSSLVFLCTNATICQNFFYLFSQFFEVKLSFPAKHKFLVCFIK